MPSLIIIDFFQVRHGFERGVGIFWICLKHRFSRIAKPMSVRFAGNNFRFRVHYQLFVNVLEITDTKEHFPVQFQMQTQRPHFWLVPINGSEEKQTCFIQKIINFYS